MSDEGGESANGVCICEYYITADPVLQSVSCKDHIRENIVKKFLKNSKKELTA